MKATLVFFWICLSLQVLAQTSFCPDDPPLNPWLADSPYPIYHRNNYAQASTCLPGITASDKVVIKRRTNITGSTSPWIYLSDKYPNGERVILYSNSTHVFKFIDEGERLLAIDSLRIDFDRFNSVGYNFLLSRDRVWFSYDNAYEPERDKYSKLFRFTDRNKNDPYSGIIEEAELNFKDYDINKVGAYSLNYSGQIVFNSHSDFEAGWATTGVIDQELTLLDTLRYTIFPNEEVHHNSIAIDENNSYYIVTTHRLIQFTWDGNEIKIGWQALYDFINDGPTGNFANGSGTTPTLMGWGEGNDKLVIVADGHAKNNLVAFWRELPPGWQGVPGMDPHFADSMSIPFAASFGNLFQSIENSPTVYGYDVAIAQFNGFLGYDCVNNKGVQKFTWDTASNNLKLAWAINDLNMNGVLSYSAGSNLVYGTGKEADCNYYYYGLNWDSGDMDLRLLLGAEEDFPDDPFYDQGVNHIIDEDGSIYFSGSRSLIKLEKVQPDITTRIPSLSQEGPQVYPNPTSGRVKIEGHTGEPIGFKILSMEGKLLIYGSMISNEFIDLGRLEAGMYLLSLRKGDKVYYQKIIKVH
ncbi:MAG: T9SS type A sorting domain-containing protein [Bacteroidota bacterium]